MELARGAAALSAYRFRLGAIVVAGGRIRGVGYTKSKNNPQNLCDHHLKSSTVHAEVDALGDLRDLKRATAYVCRLSAKNEPAMAKPCDDCMLALFDRGVTKVYWTIDSSRIGYSRVEVLN